MSTVVNGGVVREFPDNFAGSTPGSRKNTIKRTNSFTGSNGDNDTHSIASGAAKTITLNGEPDVGVAFSVRFTTAWAITCVSLSKNGAAPVSNGLVAANSLITFLHEGEGTWLATGKGLT